MLNSDAATAASIAHALGARRIGSGWSARCPCHCDRSPSLSIGLSREGAVLVHCFSGCSQARVIDALRARGLWPQRRETQSGPGPKPVTAPHKVVDDTVARRDRALPLWQRARSPAGTVVEQYLRRARKYDCPLPATVRFLPARRQHPPSMIAAFGIPEEPEPGLLFMPDDRVVAVHITRLRGDGLGKAGTDRDKIMVGPVSGCPIVLAPMNDALGLIICEGIESGLSLYEAAGCGVWVAGSASQMPALADAVPEVADCITVDCEADPAGRKYSTELAQRLVARGLHVEMRCLSEAMGVAA